MHSAMRRTRGRAARSAPLLADDDLARVERGIAFAKGNACSPRAQQRAAQQLRSKSATKFTHNQAQREFNVPSRHSRHSLPHVESVNFF